MYRQPARERRGAGARQRPQTGQRNRQAERVTRAGIGDVKRRGLAGRGGNGADETDRYGGTTRDAVTVETALPALPSLSVKVNTTVLTPSGNTVVEPMTAPLQQRRLLYRCGRTVVGRPWRR